MLHDQSPASLLLAWLSRADQLPASADAVLGFGHFDHRIPALCGKLASGGRAKHIILTGGIGAGTGTLGQPEADMFRAELSRYFPHLESTRITVENRSTNTAENIRFSSDILALDPRGLAFGSGIRSAILVVHPLRLCRVRQTWRKLQPSVAVAAVAPSTSVEIEEALYAKEKLSFSAQLVGEVDRIVSYPEKGWIEAINVPPEILAARDQLQASL